ncbi:hypothetical protein P618_200065 [Holospora obtusa F1]|uniref:Uncharacterized protein n=1 Tax=Holospora obtusa F1 TaxID=1399147 RepID=W6TFH2_HOLOB|nr:hypothetical protein [Holospora obtusa]ETZ07754.1 hypothetical protein P618_200065 [Holospora obtusa F1]
MFHFINLKEPENHLNFSIVELFFYYFISPDLNPIENFGHIWNDGLGKKLSFSRAYISQLVLFLFYHNSTAFTVKIIELVPCNCPWIQRWTGISF